MPEVKFNFILILSDIKYRCVSIRITLLDYDRLSYASKPLSIYYVVRPKTGALRERTF